MLGFVPFFIGFIVVIAAAIVATLFGDYRKETILPRDWPIIRMSPALLTNLHRLHDYFVEILERSGGSFAFQPQNSWLADVFWLTSDPSNVHHIMSASFPKYPKGIEWRKRFVLFGDSIFNTDFEEWKYQRRLLVGGFLNHHSFRRLMQISFEDGLAKQLLPDLELASKQQDEQPVAFQHLVRKHIYYISSRMLTGCDIDSFLINSHENLFSKAIGDACEAILYRHILPESIWKLQIWLGLGTEKRLSEAKVTLDRLVSEYVSRHQEKLSSRLKEEDADNISALEHLIIPYSASDKAIRDNCLAFMFAVHDTTSTALSWFFWIISKHPLVEKRIREEIQTLFPKNEKKKLFGATELNKMVYLHAALCETLRLYPPVPFQARTPLQKDTLPSGHKVDSRTMVFISIYAMGRMSSIWGDDCKEFKPERWIGDHGGIKHEPAHKFFAFLAGPRICPGKDIAFSLMKATIAAMLHNYDIEVVENQRIANKLSIVLHMNHDLMVTVKKRSVA